MFYHLLAVTPHMFVLGYEDEAEQKTHMNMIKQQLHLFMQPSI